MPDKDPAQEAAEQRAAAQKQADEYYREKRQALDEVAPKTNFDLSKADSEQAYDAQITALDEALKATLQAIYDAYCTQETTKHRAAIWPYFDAQKPADCESEAVALPKQLSSLSYGEQNSPLDNLKARLALFKQLIETTPVSEHKGFGRSWLHTFTNLYNNYVPDGNVRSGLSTQVANEYTRRERASAEMDKLLAQMKALNATLPLSAQRAIPEQATLDQALTDLATAKTSVSDTKRALEDAQTALGTLRTANERYQTAAQSASRATETATSLKEAAQQDAAQAKATVKTLETRLSDSTTALAAAQSTISGLRGELDTQASRAEEDIKRMQRELDTVREQLRKTEETNTELQAQAAKIMASKTTGSRPASATAATASRKAATTRPAVAFSSGATTAGARVPGVSGANLPVHLTVRTTQPQPPTTGTPPRKKQ